MNSDRFTHRRYNTTDNQRVRDFLSALYSNKKHPYYSIDASNWERFCAMPDDENQNQIFHLWVQIIGSQTKLIGLAQYQNHSCEVSCQALKHEVEILHEMYLWALQLHQSMQIGIPLKASVCDSNSDQQKILTELGFIAGKVTTLFRKRVLTQEAPSISLPNGFDFIDLQDASEELRIKRTQIENQVFNRTLTTDFLQKLETSPIYRPDLDVMITTLDGSIAAFGTVWFDQQNRVGYFEPVGTSAEYRHRGFAQALMIKGLRLLYALGAKMVYLGHQADNTAANRLYESVGMKIFDQEKIWTQQL